MKARRLLAVVVAAGVALVGCSGGKDRGTEERTLVFAQFGEPPATLDPALSGNVVTYIVTRPVLETLVSVRPGGTDVRPQLATSWEVSADARSWTFRLRDNVRFHDGTAFDASAVCANFNRWYHFGGILQQLASEWRRLFGGFAGQGDGGLYRSCEAPAEHEVVINLTKGTGTFLPGLALPAFAIASPEALRRYKADSVSGIAEQPVFDGTFGTDNLIGTGPFKLQSWTRNDRLALVRNEAYWGQKPALDRVIVRRIDDGAARRQALESGEVDGYLPVDAADVPPLRGAGFKVYDLPGFSLGFLGFNKERPPLDNLMIRRAIAHALDLETVVRAKYPASASLAKGIVPPDLWGHAADVRAYPHDPDQARRLLAGSGVANPTVEIWYPTGLAQGPPAIPDPEGIALAVKNDLEAVGFRVLTRPTPWMPDWEEALSSGKVHMFLGDIYAFRVDPDALFDGLAASYDAALGAIDAELRTILDQAADAIDQRARTPLYQQANRMVMQDLPVVPFVHVKPAIVFSPKVSGYRPSPIFWEGLFDVRIR